MYASEINALSIKKCGCYTLSVELLPWWLQARIYVDACKKRKTKLQEVNLIVATINCALCGLDKGFLSLSPDNKATSYAP